MPPFLWAPIFDVSGSMASKIDRAREAILQFFKTANPQDEFFMIAFADKPERVTDFTQSTEDIQGELVYTVPKGRTALLDAIYLGLSKMRQAKYEKRALLIISDGGDNHSRYTESEIKKPGQGIRRADLCHRHLRSLFSDGRRTPWSTTAERHHRNHRWARILDRQSK